MVGSFVGPGVGVLVGEPVGFLVGDLVGELVGCTVGGGGCVGWAVPSPEGLAEGDVVGATVVGDLVGGSVGLAVGDLVGSLVTGDVVGPITGAFVGETVGPRSEINLSTELSIKKHTWYRFCASSSSGNSPGAVPSFFIFALSPTQQSGSGFGSFVHRQARTVKVLLKTRGSSEYEFMSPSEPESI